MSATLNLKVTFGQIWQQTLSDQLETQRFSPNKQEGINTGITVRNTLRQVCNNTG